MVYMGSKNRIAKYLLPFLTKYLTPDRWYVEPFAGGLNMMDKVNHPLRLASDKNNYIIAMFKYLTDGGTFDTLPNQEEFVRCRKIFNKIGFTLDIDYYVAYIGWVGAIASRVGKFYLGSSCIKGAEGRNFLEEHRRNLLRQLPNLQGIIWAAGDYDKIDIPNNSVIYCDPPYAGTTKYKASKVFDHGAFFEWCRTKTYKGNDVLVSEYTAPSDFKAIWAMSHTNSLNLKNTYKPIEKLFVHESIADKYKEKTLFG